MKKLWWLIVLAICAQLVVFGFAKKLIKGNFLANYPHFKSIIVEDNKFYALCCGL